MASGSPGIPWFPFDVHLDDKFELIEAEYGLTGFAVVVKLLQKIYGGQGYYCEFTKDVALLFSRNIGVGYNVVSEIVSASIRRGIFDKDIYEKYGVLTSKGIQTRYFEAVNRRINIEVKKEYLLVQVDQKYKNVNILSGNVDILGENVYRNGQSKEEYSKEENIRLENNKEKNAPIVDNRLAKIIKLYQDNIAPIVPIIADDMEKWLTKVEPDVIEWAIKEAVKSKAPNWKYITGILNNHFKVGRTTMNQINNASGAYKANPENLSVYDDTGFDYDKLEEIMEERYDT